MIRGVEELSHKLRTHLKDGIDISDAEDLKQRECVFGDNKVRPPKLDSFFHFMCH
jgi:hypothetical protein